MQIYVVLLHEHVFGNEYSTTEVRGLYRSRDAAQKLCDWLKSSSSFNWDVDAVEIQEHTLE